MGIYHADLSPQDTDYSTEQPCKQGRPKKQPATFHEALKAAKDADRRAKHILLKGLKKQDD